MRNSTRTGALGSIEHLRIRSQLLQCQQEQTSRSSTVTRLGSENLHEVAKR